MWVVDWVVTALLAFVRQPVDHVIRRQDGPIFRG